MALRNLVGPRDIPNVEVGMRVICWNVRGATAASPAWKYLLDWAPDLALLQEVGALPKLVTEQYACRAAFPVRKNGSIQRFQTVILARGSLVSALTLRGTENWVNLELDRFAGNLVASQVKLDAGPLLKAISVYSPAWPVARSRLTGIDVSSVRLTQNPDVWVADLLWAALRRSAPSESDAWLVAGDFNLSETFDLWKDGPRGNASTSTEWPT
jgi:hypothetical protein